MSSHMQAGYQAVLRELQAPRPVPLQYTPPPTLPRANLINRSGPRPQVPYNGPTGGGAPQGGAPIAPGGGGYARRPMQMLAVAGSTGVGGYAPVGVPLGASMAGGIPAWTAGVPASASE